MQVDPAAQDAKLNAVHEKLTNAATSLVTSEDWRSALEFAAQFRSRLFDNSLLIYAQHVAAYQEGRVPEPTPSYVAGFKVAQSRPPGREGAVRLPDPRSGDARFASPTPEVDGSWRRLARGEGATAAESVRSRMIGLRPAYVSQTSGAPIPERPRPQLLEGHAPAGLWDGLAGQVESRGFALQQVPNARVIGGANGLTEYLAREVSVRADMDPAAQVKTLGHELGHVMLHGPDNADAARGIAEIEAESVALMVGAAHGMDTSAYTVPYASSWAEAVPARKPVEVVQATADRVRAAAVAVLDNLDTAQVGGGDPPGLDREAARPASHCHPKARSSGLAQPAEAVGL